MIICYICICYIIVSIAHVGPRPGLPGVSGREETIIQYIALYNIYYSITFDYSIILRCVRGDRSAPRRIAKEKRTGMASTWERASHILGRVWDKSDVAESNVRWTPPLPSEVLAGLQMTLWDPHAPHGLALTELMLSASSSAEIHRCKGLGGGLKVCRGVRSQVPLRFPVGVGSDFLLEGSGVETPGRSGGPQVRLLRPRLRLPHARLGPGVGPGLLGLPGAPAHAGLRRRGGEGDPCSGSDPTLLPSYPRFASSLSPSRGEPSSCWGCFRDLSFRGWA